MHTNLTPTQQQARERFDLDAAMAALPDEPPKTQTTKGAAGHRLNGELSAQVSDGLLKEFARKTLGAVRIGPSYLQALRVILGNQAEAERRGYTLEMNIRTGFASEWVMRNIINQMKDAGITEGVRVGLGGDKAQVVQCYVPKMGPTPHRHSDLNAMLRAEEDHLEAGRNRKTWEVHSTANIPAEDVPY